MEAVYDMNRFATEDFLPDLTFYLDVDPELGLRRVMENAGREVNRLDLEGLQFHQKVREGYELLRQQNPGRIVRIDASQSVEAVFEAVCREIVRIL